MNAKIYTLAGDQGETGLSNGQRVSKDAARVEAIGSIDELNSAIGVARAEALQDDMDALLERRQHELFAVGAEIAAVHASTADLSSADRAVRADGRAERHFRPVDGANVAELESAIDAYQSRLPPIHNFILPTGCRAAAALHVARTTCRRAERRVVAWSRAEAEDTAAPRLKKYLNRLSDLLFVLARAANHASGIGDQPWRKQ